MSEYTGQMDAALNTLYDTSYAAGFKAGREAGMREAARLLRDEDWQNAAVNNSTNEDQSLADDFADAILAAIGEGK